MLVNKSFHSPYLRPKSYFTICIEMPKTRLFWTNTSMCHNWVWVCVPVPNYYQYSLDHCPMPISAQCRSKLQHWSSCWSKLIIADQCRWAMIDIERYFGSMPGFWSALGIDRESPNIIYKTNGPRQIDQRLTISMVDFLVGLYSKETWKQSVANWLEPTVAICFIHKSSAGLFGITVLTESRKFLPL